MSSAEYGSAPPTLQYHVNKHQRQHKCSLGSLVDRGANGGILGRDARVILVHLRKVNVTSIDNPELNELKIIDTSATAMTQYIIFANARYLDKTALSTHVHISNTTRIPFMIAP